MRSLLLLMALARGARAAGQLTGERIYEDPTSQLRALSASDDGSYVGFHDLAVKMPVARSDHTVTLFDQVTYDLNGPRIYIVGGCVADQVCSYNQACWSTVNAGKNTCVFCACTGITKEAIYFTPETNKYTTITPSPTARYRAQAAGVGTKLYVFGGRDLYDTLVQTVDVLDTTTNLWTTFTVGSGDASSMLTTETASDGGAFASGGKVYLVGGYDKNYGQNNTLLRIDVSTTPWTVTRSLAAMPTGRGDISVQLFKSEFYVLGGWNTAYTSALKTVESYNVDSDVWTTRPDMMYARGDLAVGVIGNSLFAIAGEQRDAATDPGGDTALSFPVPWVTRFSLASNKFQLEQSLSVNRFRFVGVSYNSTTSYLSTAIYLFGGQSDYDSSCSCFHMQADTLKYIPVSTYSAQVRYTDTHTHILPSPVHSTSKPII